jgi:5'-nucleotidase
VPNLKQDQIPAYKITRQGKRIYGDVVYEKTDPRGRKYYWLGGNNLSFEKEEGTDFDAVTRGYISITPLHPNLTCVSCIGEAEKWNI